MTVTIGIVGCSKTKLDRPAPARQLYTSPLFKAAAAYCERAYDRWLILSALYGLVEPDRLMGPYDRTLIGMSAAGRWGWADAVAHSDLGRHVLDVIQDGGEVWLHAGALYREAFGVHGLNLTVMLPFRGLGIGQQLAWYAARRSAEGLGDG